MILIHKTTICKDNGTALEQEPFSKDRFYFQTMEELESYRLRSEKALSKKGPSGIKIKMLFEYTEIPDQNIGYKVKYNDLIYQPYAPIY